MTEEAKDLNPYVGPRAFEEDDRKNFFGRDEETRQLTSLVIAQRTVLLYAQSGAGKTSLLQASLIPRLNARKRIKILPISRVSGDLPRGVDGTTVSNIYVFNTLLNVYGQTASPGELVGLTLIKGLQTYFESDEADRRRLRPRLLILDQFEELFTTHSERQAERADFFFQLQQALERYPQLTLLFSMREDFIAHLDFYAAQLPDRLRTRFRLERLRPKAALDAVREPATAAVPKRRFAEGVAEQLVANLAGISLDEADQEESDPTLAALESYTEVHYIEPVHLQIVCRQLWSNLNDLPAADKLPADGQYEYIRESDVQQFGDVDQALIGFYEDALRAAISKSNISERRLRTWFSTELITTRETRSLVYRDEDLGATEGLPNEAVDSLYEAYLIRATKRGGDTWYELAHDRLVEPILLSNRAWQEGQMQHDPLLQAAQAWRALRKDDALVEPKEAAQASYISQIWDLLFFAYRSKNKNLYRAQALETALSRTDLDTQEPEVIEFLEASQKAERSRGVFIGFLIASITIISFIVAVFWLSSVNSYQETLIQEADDARATADAEKAVAEKAVAELDRKTKEADAFEFANAALKNLEENNPDLSLILAIEAISKTYYADQSWVLPQAEEAIHRLPQLLGHTWHQLAHGGRSVSFSADSRFLATVAVDRTLKVWQTDTGQVLPFAVDDTLQIKEAMFSPNDLYLATINDDFTVFVWDLSDGKKSFSDRTSGRYTRCNFLSGRELSGHLKSG